MFKLMKYEYRKKLVPYIVLIAVFAALYMYGIIAILVKSEAHTALSVSLFALGSMFGILYIMILAVETYSKELSSKTSYMIFMTPNSTYKIIGAKVLSTFVAAIALTTVYSAMLYSMIRFASLQFPEWKELEDITKSILTIQGVNVERIGVSIVATIVIMWMQLFTIVCIAYSAITISATLFSNKKGKGFLSVLFFAIILVVYMLISKMLPELDYGDTIAMMLLAQFPSYILDLVVIAASFFTTSYLLDKKVSL